MPVDFNGDILDGISDSISVPGGIVITDWRVSPANVFKYIGANELNPSSETITVAYPEFDKMDEYNSYDSFRLAFEFDSPFLNIITEQEVLSHIIPNSNQKAFFEVAFQNIESLNIGMTPITIYHRAYGRIGNTETLLEERQTKLILNKLSSNTDHIRANKNIYNLVYNLEDEGLHGDLNIEILGYKEGVQLQLQGSINTFHISIDPEQNVGHYIISQDAVVDDIVNAGEEYSHTVWVVYNGLVYDQFKINVTVVGFNHDLFQNNLSNNFNFCLENRYLKVIKSTPEVSRITLKMNLIYEYDEAIEVEETYEYIFLTDELYINPGEEIHDFFRRLQPSWLSKSEVQDLKGLKTIEPKNLFKVCMASFEITEYNSEWESFAVHTLPNTKWLPGNLPSGFPYLTNAQIRRTYQDSLISLCAVQQYFLENKLHSIASPLLDSADIREADWVVQTVFDRHLVDSNYGRNQVVSHVELTLEPFPDPDKVIHVIFENQNLCPDWFSFAENYEIEPVVEHNMTSNLSKGRKFKANITKEETLILNTGWILEEEVSLLSELIEGGLCFVKTPDMDWIKCIPVSKKPLKVDSERKMHMQIVEFEIIQDER